MVDTPDTERVLERDLVAGHPRSPTIVTHKPVQVSCLNIWIKQVLLGSVVYKIQMEYSQIQHFRSKIDVGGAHGS